MDANAVMSSQSLYILWDESQIWGLLAWRGAAGLGVRARLVRASVIRQGLLQSAPPAMLMVPGGTARLKAEALGARGMQAIRDYVAAGGHYLGFCGGAGLGLSAPAEDGVSRDLPAKMARHGARANTDADSLGLCPWSRGAYEDRMQHFMSGHLEASFNMPEHALSPAPPEHALIPQISGDKAASAAPLLPVWWPGRFLPEVSPKASPLAGEASVLAHYGRPGKDFWLADLPVALLPQEAFSDWHALYGVNVSPAFLEGQACLAHGAYGKGTYTLSYSHLETPGSPFANRWLAHIMRELGGLKPQSEAVPAWKLEDEPINWPDADLAECLDILGGLINTGLEHNLLFKRNDWLFGWRPGVPGLQLTSLYAVLASILSLKPEQDALLFWDKIKEEMMPKMRLFASGVTGYLLAERLSMTLARNMPETISAGMLTVQREALFGARMRPGGLYQQLMPQFEELAFLQIAGNGLV